MMYNDFISVCLEKVFFFSPLPLLAGYGIAVSMLGLVRYTEDWSGAGLGLERLQSLDEQEEPSLVPYRNFNFHIYQETKPKIQKQTGKEHTRNLTTNLVSPTSLTPGVKRTREERHRKKKPVSVFR